MAMYRLTANTFIRSGTDLRPRLHRAGEIVETDDLPSPRMIPLDDEGAAAQTAAIASLSTDAADVYAAAAGRAGTPLAGPRSGQARAYSSAMTNSISGEPTTRKMKRTY